MKKALLSVAAAILPIAMIAATRSESFPGNLNAISASSGLSVQYTPGAASTHVIVNAPDDVIQYILVEKKGSTLNIGIKSHPKKKRISLKEVSVTVSAPTVGNISVSSGADINVMAPFSSTSPLKLNASSSGDIDFGSLNCSSLSAATSSGADIEIKSLTTTQLNISASSSGDVDIENAQCTMAKVAVSAGSDVKIKAINANSIDGTASSGSEITIAGIVATDVNAAASSGAEVKLSGKADNINANASSGGSISLKKLAVRNCNANSSSGGSIDR